MSDEIKPKSISSYVPYYPAHQLLFVTPSAPSATADLLLVKMKKIVDSVLRSALLASFSMLPLGPVQAGNTDARLFLPLENATPAHLLLSFTNLRDVQNYYGVNSAEASLAKEFYRNAKSPPYYTMYFIRFPGLPARSHIFGADINVLSTIPAIRAVRAGQVRLTANGFTYTTPPLNFSSDTTFTEIGNTLQRGLNANLPEAAQTRNSTITPQTAKFTATILTGILYVTQVAAGTIRVGALVCETSVPCSETSTDYIGQINSQIPWEPGTPNGPGYYVLQHGHRAHPSEKMVATYGLLTVGAISGGALSVGEHLTGNVLPDTNIEGEVGASGLQWVVNHSQTKAATNIDMTGPELSVIWSSSTGATANRGYYLIQQEPTANWEGSTISYATDVPGAQPVVDLLGLHRGDQGANGIPHTGAFADSPGSIVSSPAKYMNNFVSTYGDVATTFQLAYPVILGPPGVMTALQKWDADGPMTYLQNCSYSTNSIVSGGPC